MLHFDSKASRPTLVHQHVTNGRLHALAKRVTFHGLGQNLERYMDLLSRRQSLVASNIANADTPGYKTRDLDFQFEFMSLAQGEEPTVIEAAGLKSKNDGNNVSMDRETRLLAENAIRFNVASQLLRSQMRVVRLAIQDGKG